MNLRVRAMLSARSRLERICTAATRRDATCLTRATCFAARSASAAGTSKPKAKTTLTQANLMAAVPLNMELLLECSLNPLRHRIRRKRPIGRRVLDGQVRRLDPAVLLRPAAHHRFQDPGGQQRPLDRVGGVAGLDGRINR